MKAHQKHAALTRPELGFFHRNEWAILGTNCGNIKKTVFALIQSLSDNYKIGYIDADHASADDASGNGKTATGAMAHGAAVEYTNKISHHRFEYSSKLDSYQYRPLFNEQDLVLVNGNHFEAKQQIVVLDPKKEQSLQRRLARLTDVVLFLQRGNTPIFDFLKEAMPNWAEIPLLASTDLQGISTFVKEKMERTTPALSGLVLAGGKSQRMGYDKTVINYHGKPQREFLYDLVSQRCENTFLSCRPEQEKELATAYPTLGDSFSGLGPFGAILSAFRHQPNHAWLVIASDLPLLDAETLDFLIRHRNPSKMATCFYNPATDFPDPLLTIWEPRAYQILLQFLAQGYSCPRKALINSAIEQLHVPNPAVLKNVNKPEEYEEVLALLKAGRT